MRRQTSSGKYEWVDRPTSVARVSGKKVKLKENKHTDPAARQTQAEHVRKNVQAKWVNVDDIKQANYGKLNKKQKDSYGRWAKESVTAEDVKGRRKARQHMAKWRTSHNFAAEIGRRIDAHRQHNFESQDPTRQNIVTRQGKQIARTADARGNSFRVYTAKSKPRNRRKKEEHERLENERKRHKKEKVMIGVGAGVGTAALATGLGLTAHKLRVRRLQTSSSQNMQKLKQELADQEQTLRRKWDDELAEKRREAAKKGAAKRKLNREPAPNTIPFANPSTQAQRKNS